VADQLQDLSLRLKTIGLKTGKAEVDALSASVMGLTSAVTGTGKAQVKQGKVLTDATGKTRRFTKASDRARISTQRMGKQVDETGKGFLGLNDTLDKTIRKVALWTVSTTVIFGTLRAFGAAGRVITEHDTDMTSLRKVYSGAQEDLAGIEKTVIQVGKAMQSLNEAAFGAGVTVARTGRQGVDLIRLTTGALIAQNIAELEAADAVRFLNSALIQFDQETDQAIRVLDEWNELSNKTPATTMDLAQAVSVAGSVFKQAGADIQFLNASTAALVEITAKSGNIIGRAERTMAIYAQRQSTVNLLAGIGVKVFEGMEDSFIGIDRLLTILAKKWRTLTDRQRAALAQSVAGARQQQFFIALMENQDLVLGNLQTQWKSFGSAVKENELFLQSISKRVDGLTNSLERLAIGLGDAGAVSVIKGVIRVLTDMVNALVEANGAMALLAAGVGVLAASFIGLQTAMGPLGIVLLALSAFVLTLTQLNNVFDTTAKRMREFNEGIEKAQGNVIKLNAQSESLRGMVRELENLEAAGEKGKIKDMLVGIDEITKELFGRDVITSVDNYALAMSDLQEALKGVRGELKKNKIAALELEIAAIKAKATGPGPADITSGGFGIPGGLAGVGVSPAGLSEVDLRNIAKKEKLIADIRAGKVAPEGRTPFISGEDTAKLNALRDQETILNRILAGAAEEEIIRLKMFQLQSNMHALVGDDEKTQAAINQMLQLQIDLQEVQGKNAEDRLKLEEEKTKEFEKQEEAIAAAIERGRRDFELSDRKFRQKFERDAKAISRAFDRPLAQAIAGGFRSAEIKRAAHSFATDFGNMLSDTVGKSIRDSMMAAGATELAAGFKSGLASGLISGALGFVANALFGRQDEDERQVSAVEDNTAQLRVLNDNISDLTSFFVNAPAGFAVPAGGGAPTVGGAAAIAGGRQGPSTSIQDNRSVSVGVIEVVSQPGQSNADIGAAVVTAIQGQFAGGSVETDFQ